MSHVKKNAFLLPISIIMLISLACGMQTNLPHAVQNDTIPVAETSVEVNTVEMVVVADTLNLRACGSTDCAADPKGLRNGQRVKVYLTCTGGEMRDWVALNRDCTKWVKASWLK